jgi:hypothetical protein
MLLKTDGNGLYATKDRENASRKFQDFHIEKNLYVVDFFLPTTIYSGFKPSINRANFLGFAAKFTSKNPEKW